MDSSGSGTIANAIRCIDHCMYATALYLISMLYQNTHADLWGPC